VDAQHLVVHCLFVEYNTHVSISGKVSQKLLELANVADGWLFKPGAQHPHRGLYITSLVGQVQHGEHR
jgi:hypothetical protein